MTKLRSKVIAAAGVVVAAGGLAIAGLTAASASPPASRTGIEHFQLMTTSATSTSTSLIATGRFTAGGTDHPGNTTDLAVFPNGTFKITHSPGKGTQHFNPRTCLGVIHLHGTYRLGHGTGRYAGISGHGRYRLSILFVGARSKGMCTQKQPPPTFQQIIRAQGPVHL